MNGINNPTDNCLFASNLSQADTDGDGLGDDCDSSDFSDFDADADPNSADNCPFVANADQADTDADGQGNVCDAVVNAVPLTMTDVRSYLTGVRVKCRKVKVRSGKVLPKCNLVLPAV